MSDLTTTVKDHPLAVGLGLLASLLTVLLAIPQIYGWFDAGSDDKGSLGSSGTALSPSITDTPPTSTTETSPVSTTATSVERDDPSTSTTSGRDPTTSNVVAPADNPTSSGTRTTVKPPVTETVTSATSAATTIPDLRLPDIDGNGRVENADNALLLADIGTSMRRSDLDYSGVVDVKDLAILLPKLGTAVAPRTTTTQAPPVQLDPPPNFQAAFDGGSSTVFMSWEMPGFQESFTIFRSGIAIATVSAATNNYRDTDPVPGRLLRYQIRSDGPRSSRPADSAPSAYVEVETPR